MTGAALAALSAFMFLSPEQPGPYTRMDGAGRADLEAAYAAGKQPLVIAKDDVEALTNVADVVSAVVLDVLPRPNLRHTWRGLGVKVLRGVEFDEEGSAEYFRRSCAFLPFRYGADGVYIKNPDKLPDTWKTALAEAKKDAEVIDYLRSLAEKAAAHDDPLVRMEARRVQWWFGYMEAGWENLDCLRLECVAYAKRLEQFLGLPEKDLPLDYAPAPEPDTTRFRPYANLPEQPRQINLEGLANSGVKLDDSGLFTFSSNKQGFSFTFVCTNGPELAQWRYPIGTGKFTLSFYIPSGKEGEFSPYHFEIDTQAFWVQPRAATPGLWSYLYALEERFTPYTTGYARQQHRVHPRPQLRTFGPGHARLDPSLSIKGRKGGGWTATVSFSWFPLFGRWPCVVNGKSDLWYVGIDRLPDGSHPAPKRLLWPRGRESNLKSITSAINLGSLTSRYKGELDATEKVWGTAYRERLYGFRKTPKPTFHRYDLESDEIFRKRCLQPLLDANKSAWELIQTDKEHKGKLRAQNDTVQALVWKSLDKMLYLDHNVGLARRDYLRDRFAGKMPPEPQKKKADKAPGPAEGEFIENGDFNKIQLDDVEF